MGSFRGVAAASIDWIATIRGRLGLLVQPNLLVYGTAGLAVVNAEAHASVAALGMGQISAREFDQFVYGLEADISSADIGISETLVVPGAVFNASADFGVVREGLNFKFGP